MKEYLDLALQGKNNWWRYVLAVLFILFFWIFLAFIPYTFVSTYLALDGNPATGINSTGFIGLNPLVTFVIELLTIIPLLFTTLIGVRFIHQRSMLSLITPAAGFNFKRFFSGFWVWFVLSAATSLVEAYLYPGRYSFTLNITELLPFALAALILIPLQTSAEEVFFRGYILQSFGIRIRNIYVLSFISGFIFMLPHLGNPEMAAGAWTMALSYFSMGAFAAFFTLKDGRMELALGIHAANNIYASIFANYTISALLTPSIFTVNTLDATYGLIALLVSMQIFYFVFFNPYPLHLPENS